MPSKKISRSRKRRAPDALTVRASKTSSGRPSVAIHAEVRPEKLKAELGEFKQIEEVVAEVPIHQGGEVHWQDTPLHKLGEVKEPNEDQKALYSSTSYGPSDAEEYGVRVRVKTDKGVARSEPEPGHSVREADKPRRDPARRH